jgi:hypothetical protein
MPNAATTAATALASERDVRRDFVQSIAMETPIRARLKTAPRPLSSTPEWGIETFHAPNKAGWPEGKRPADGDRQSNQDTVRYLKGRFIKLLRPVGVTKEQKLMGAEYHNGGKGNGQTLAKSVTQATVELYVDCETQIMADDESVVPSGSVTASQSRSLFRWLSNANGRFTDTDTTPVADVRTPAGNIIVSKANVAAIEETDIRNLITAVVTARKKAGLKMLGVCQPGMRDRFDDYTRIAGTNLTETTAQQTVYRFSQKQGSIERDVTFYKSSNGRIELDTCFHMDSTVHFGLLTPELIEIGYAQGVMVNPDKSPSAQVEEREIDTLYVLEPRLLTAHGKIITGSVA